MQYRKLGPAGIRVSQLSFGSWVTFANQLHLNEVTDTMNCAWDHGVNFFDNAEVYAHGKSELVMGEALKKLNWPRLKYLISTKFFWGISEGPNETNTLNRKYLLHAMEGSLKRLQLDYVDLVYCHRPDPTTSIEEVCWAMHNIIEKGQALYWGTSEWSASEYQAALEISEKHHLHKPVVEQPQYNLFHREKVEQEYQPILSKKAMGLTTWSPLASGVLTGKYLNGIPEGSRGKNKNLGWLQEDIQNPKRQEQVKKFVALAKSRGFSPQALAIAWCSSNPQISSVILGASSLQQLQENLKALNVIEVWNEELRRDVEACFK